VLIEVEIDFRSTELVPNLRFRSTRLEDSRDCVVRAKNTSVLTRELERDDEEGEREESEDRIGFRRLFVRDCKLDRIRV